MDLAWREAEIRVRSVRWRRPSMKCIDFPECYALPQIYPDETPHGAILQVAIVRGKQWQSQCHGPAVEIR